MHCVFFVNFPIMQLAKLIFECDALSFAVSFVVLG
jgi:hypothetical protein